MVGIQLSIEKNVYFKRTANVDIFWSWRISDASMSLPLVSSQGGNRNNGDIQQKKGL